MSYILVMEKDLFLPHAVKLEADTVDTAISEVLDVVRGQVRAKPQWLFEIATGDVRRVFLAGDEVILSDTAFRSDLGEATGVEFFIKEEADQCEQS